MSHTSENDQVQPCGCKPSESIPFLDTLCTIKNGKVITDLYRKPTDRNQYLLTSSCHPAHVPENIPFSQALRITRICSEDGTKEKRFSELKQLFLDRQYPEKIIDAAITKARAIPRLEALKPASAPPQTTTRRPVFVVPYDPRLPSVQPITLAQWKVMTHNNPHMKEVFPQPPLIAHPRLPC